MHASQNNPAFDRFDIFLVSLLFKMAFERSSSADTADFKEGILKYDCLCNEFSKDYNNKYTKMNCWKNVADKFDMIRLFWFSTITAIIWKPVDRWDRPDR